MPWTLSNPPPPAKNWNKSQKQKCVTAANAVLRRGGSDKEAVFACIHAAGKSTRTKQRGDGKERDYDLIAEEYKAEFQRLVLAYLAGYISISEFGYSMREELLSLHLAMMRLGIGDSRDITEDDMAWLENRLGIQYEYLDGFMDDLYNNRASPDRFLWRVGLYAYPRSVFVNFSIPPGIGGLMPYLPGDDCLGGANCHCTLDVQYVEDEIHVYWLLDPMSHNCVVCIEHAAESPFVFNVEDL